MALNLIAAIVLFEEYVCCGLSVVSLLCVSMGILKSRFLFYYEDTLRQIYCRH